MPDKILLLVRLIVETSHIQINDAIRELETETQISIPDTQNVRVLNAEILTTYQKKVS
jgi:hypothetical protein